LVVRIAFCYVSSSRKNSTSAQVQVKILLRAFLNERAYSVV